MTNAGQALLEQLLASPTPDGQRQLLITNRQFLDDSFAALLKERSNHYLHADGKRCSELADLLLIQAELTENRQFKALGLLAKANYAIIGQGDYQQGLAIFEEIDRLYEQLALPVHKAKAQLSKIVALAHLGRYAEAAAIERWAAPVLEAHAEWKHLSGLILNLAVACYGRRGDAQKALELLDRAGIICRHLGDEGLSHWASVEENRAQYLYNLGHLDESIVAAQQAHQLFCELGYTIEAARAQENLAETLMLLGHYNRALELLDHVREIFRHDSRYPDVLRVDLDTTSCLLNLRRFQDVLATCRRIRAYFSKEGVHLEMGRAVLNEAIAYAALHRYEEAADSLREAHDLFAQEEGQTWAALTQLELAVVSFYQGNYLESQHTAQSCIQIFLDRGFVIQAAHAKLVHARAALALSHLAEAEAILTDVMTFSQQKAIPILLYQCRFLMGRLAIAQGHQRLALEQYAHAIQALEELRGQLMLEFRIGFLEDKSALYEEAVALCLSMGQAEAGLAYVERAKSRALLDLLSAQLDLRLQPKAEADRQLVEQLTALRKERERLYYRTVGSAYETKTLAAGPDEPIFRPPDQEVLAIEQQITALWHRLLIRNADYAGDAALWSVRTEPIAPYLDAQTLLLEYFVIDGAIYLFTVSAEKTVAHKLPLTLELLQKLLRRLWLNLRMVTKSNTEQLSALTEQAKALSIRLYTLLLAPIRPQIDAASQLYIVPHGPLHYLPFHALHDGTDYLLTTKRFAYLPSGSMLHYLHQAQDRSPINQQLSCATFGYSLGGQLPHVAAEAQMVADLFAGCAHIEADATKEKLQEVASQSTLLHIATHGDFRADNPLFSGLTMADGTVTTLDIFDLSLNAALVTLSACQTGRSVVGGGDELLGLLRAFLSAGAAALLLTMWPVEDRSTLQLMQHFYSNLNTHMTPSRALQNAQQEIMQIYPHPYFWAPFFLIGTFGPLYKKDPA